MAGPGERRRQSQRGSESQGWGQEAEPGDSRVRGASGGPAPCKGQNTAETSGPQWGWSLKRQREGSRTAGGMGLHPKEDEVQLQEGGQGPPPDSCLL